MLVGCPGFSTHITPQSTKPGRTLHHFAEHIHHHIIGLLIQNGFVFSFPARLINRIAVPIFNSVNISRAIVNAIVRKGGISTCHFKNRQIRRPQTNRRLLRYPMTVWVFRILQGHINSHFRNEFADGFRAADLIHQEGRNRVFRFPEAALKRIHFTRIFSIRIFRRPIIFQMKFFFI